MFRTSLWYYFGPSATGDRAVAPELATPMRTRCNTRRGIPVDPHVGSEPIEARKVKIPARIALQLFGRKVCRFCTTRKIVRHCWSIPIQVVLRKCLVHNSKAARPSCDMQKGERQRGDKSGQQSPYWIILKKCHILTQIYCAFSSNWTAS